MSHPGNWQRNPRKLALERWRAALQQAKEADDTALAPGWRRVSQGAFTPVMTPAAAVKRGASAIGRCETAECRRTLRADLAWWCDHGHGDAPLATLLATYRCGRLGCRLNFGEERYPAGRPLIDLTAHSVTQVEFRCRACGELGRWKVEDFVRLLLALGTGDGNTPLPQAAKALIIACPLCAESKGWTVRAFEPKPSYDALAWEERDKLRACARTLLPPAAPPHRR